PRDEVGDPPRRERLRHETPHAIVVGWIEEVDPPAHLVARGARRQAIQVSHRDRARPTAAVAKRFQGGIVPGNGPEPALEPDHGPCVADARQDRVRIRGMREIGRVEGDRRHGRRYARGPLAWLSHASRPGTPSSTRETATAPFIDCCRRRSAMRRLLRKASGWYRTGRRYEHLFRDARATSVTPPRHTC